MNEFLIYSLITIAKIGVVFGLVIGSVPVVVLAERKLLGWMQVRPGPNRVGPWGLLQTLVDAAKVFFKENIIPDGVEPLTYRLAPILVITPVLISASVIPFGPPVTIAGREITLAIADFDLSLLFFFAVATLSVYGIVLAGWSSNNKWSLMGGLRSSAQMFSYEITLSLSIVGILLTSGTFRLTAIAAQQAGGFWHWNMFLQPLGFVLFLLAAIAEVNRTPFDLPEAESELTGGFHTEYSGMRFVMFYMSEYSSVFVMSSVIATLFLGGYNPPFPYTFGTSWFDGAIGLFWLLAKIGALVFFFIWLRGTLPRLRYDELMMLGWKILLPLAFLNLIVTAILVALNWPGWVLGLTGVAALIVTDLVVSQILWRRRRAAG
ncbi:MAG: NADH-quinone oxidoreductase subunit NuoH [Candidatus Sumerlaeia bacterium]|nr:NADH-quinone oxidoreductase subunit NuoH [Candidatus Sumerlaeia bacterium]